MREFKDMVEKGSIDVDYLMLNGAYCYIKLPDTGIASLIMSWDNGWEHVSVAPRNKKTPTWNDMCYLKRICFKPQEVVVQYHPADKDYVNICDNCLHLWRPIKDLLPVPDKELVY